MLFPKQRNLMMMIIIILTGFGLCSVVYYGLSIAAAVELEIYCGRGVWEWSILHGIFFILLGLLQMYFIFKNGKVWILISNTNAMKKEKKTICKIIKGGCQRVDLHKNLCIISSADQKPIKVNIFWMENNFSSQWKIMYLFSSREFSSF